MDRPPKPPTTMFTPVASQPLELVEGGAPRPSPPATGSASLVHSNIGRYVVSRRLGEGGMGVVYQAVDVERCERVALKTLTGVNPTSLWRFKQEFRSLANVVHPNLVQLYELFSQDDQLYLAMELVDGVEFHDHVWVDGLPDHARIRDILRQLAHGVNALHRAGKLHLDIKPSNVMVADDGRVVLLDFGLVEEVPTELNYAAGRRYLSGTPSFMAPEQIEPRPPGPPADCYAIGVMLYEALTGALPYEAETLVDMLRAKREQPAVPPSQRVQGVPADLDQLVMRLLARDPNQRASLADILAVVDPDGGGLEESSPRPSDAPRLHGRDTQLGQLARAFDRTRRGRPVTVHVEGESGIGKTALVREFLRHARRTRDAVVLETRCYQRDSLPLKTIDGLVDSLTGYLRSLPASKADGLLPRNLAALVRLFPVLERVDAVAKLLGRAPADRAEAEAEGAALDPRGLRARAFAALRELLTRIADRHPLAVFIDDLQWGDVESGWLLEDLLEGNDAPAVLFVAGFRSGETQSPLLRELAGSASGSRGRKGMVHIQLGKLRPTDARELARRLVAERGIEDTTLADAIADEADGSPLFLEELVRYHAQTGGEGGLAPRGATPDFDEVVRRRVARLPEGTQRVLRVVAIAGRPVPIALVMAAAGTGPAPGPSGGASGGASEGPSEGTLRTLAGEHLVREMGSVDGRQVECFHGRIRDAILGGLDQATIEATHAELARVLRSLGGQPERLTLHLLSAGRSREAGEAALLAAAHAEQALAFERAAALYSVALKHMAMSEERRRDLETRRATALAAAGKVSSAAGLYLRNSARASTETGLARTSKREEMLERRRLAAEKLLQTGHLEEGTAVLGSVMAPLELGLPDTEARARVRWLGHRLWLSAFGGRMRRLEDRGSPDPQRILRCDASGTAATGLGMGDPLQGVELAARHLVLAIQAGDPRRAVEAAAFYAMRLAGWGRARQAQRWFAEAERQARRLRDLRVEGSVTLMRAMAQVERGEWKEGLAGLTQAQDTLKRSYREHGWETALIRVERLAVLAESGDLAQLARELPITIESARNGEDVFTVMAAGSRCGHLLGLAEDDIDRARLLVDAAAEHLPRGAILSWHVYVLCARVQIAQYAGDWEGAQRLLDSHWAAVEARWVGKYPTTRALLERARATTALGAAARGVDVARNLQAARTGIAWLSRSRRDVDRAAAGILAAELAALGDRREGIARAFEDAADRAQACGLHLHAAAARLRAGQEIGAEAGRSLREGALAQFEAQSIRRPLRFASLYAPGADSTPPVRGEDQ